MPYLAENGAAKPVQREPLEPANTPTYRHFMIHMLCRNRVRDYEQWRHTFDSHAEAHLKSGLRLTNVWRELGDENNVFFVFEVANLDQAKQFLNTPDAAAAGNESGVIDGDYHFVEDGGGY